MDAETIALEYRTLTASQLAAKYGLSHDAMRQWLSRHGIEDPKRPDPIRTERLVQHYVKDFGWTCVEIAEQLERSVRSIKRILRKLFGRIVQLSMWPPDAFKVEAPKMRIVHRCEVVRECKCVQLELFSVAA